MPGFAGNLASFAQKHREPLIGAGIGAVTGGLAGALPKHRYRNVQTGTEYKRPHERTTKERLKAGLVGAGVGAGIGGVAGATYKSFKQLRADQTRRGPGGWDGGGGGVPPRPRSTHSARSAAKGFSEYGSSVRHSGLDSKKAVKRAYQRAAMKHHPDRGGDAEKMKALNDFHDSIKNSDWYAGLKEASFGDASYDFFFDELSALWAE